MKLDREFDTICAIATPLGQGGIGIVRISGPESLPILRRIFRPARKDCPFSSHRLYYGTIFNPETGKDVDEALCVYMKAPKTYTREDVVEIQCHSGPAVISHILSIVMSQGARLAEPGEFTKRAFLNGRISLDQAEAILDIIEAQGSGLAELGMAGLKGGLHEILASIKEELTYCLSAIEVAIDYPEEDAEILQEEEISKRLKEKVILPIKTLIESYEKTKIQRFGVNVILIGRPNAGKSSLLNALCLEERAIVTDIPGTTRDVVERQIEINGIPVTLMDTAGIRRAPDVIEAIGIKKIHEVAKKAKIFVWLIDISEGIVLEDQAVIDFLREYPNTKIIVAFNKIDKVKDANGLAKELISYLRENAPILSKVPFCLISAKRQKGLNKLTELIFEILTRDSGIETVKCAPNLRQKQVLERCISYLSSAFENINQKMSPDIVAIDLRKGLDLLGEITGETATEDILDKIFSNFCLGK